MQATTQLAGSVGVKSACSALGLPRATWYRHQRPEPRVPRQRPRPPLALSPAEVQEAHDILISERFVDSSPRQVWATLLDVDQRYLCSVRTLYRILEAEGELRERRDHLRHPTYSKPELLATGPNQVWTWDVTKLKGPAKWTYFYLYVILDLFSRMVVGWMLAGRESTELAKQLITETLDKHDVDPEQLTLHADRGAIQTAKGVALLLADLGITKSHSRPYTSNDNPHSEAQFKTLKYHPTFPERFGSQEHARAFCRSFFAWYNTEHRHSSLALLSPAEVHYGRAEGILAQRAEVLRVAFEANPQRFKGRLPSPGKLPGAVWINPPADSPATPLTSRASGPDTPGRHEVELGPSPAGSETPVARPTSSGRLQKASTAHSVEVTPSGATHLGRTSGPDTFGRHEVELGPSPAGSETPVARPTSSGSAGPQKASTAEKVH